MNFNCVFFTSLMGHLDNLKSHMWLTIGQHCFRSLVGASLIRALHVTTDKWGWERETQGGSNMLVSSSLKVSPHQVCFSGSLHPSICACPHTHHTHAHMHAV